MRLLPLLTLVGAAQLIVPASFAAVSYLAEGVDADNITDSTRFYDNMKGSKAWSTTNSHVLDSTWELYQENPDLLGDLTSRTTLSSFNPKDYMNYYPNMVKAMQNLREDNYTCWSQVAANMIQYWQSYYGIFASNSNNLPYGYTYDKQYIYTLEGAQSLKTGLLLYDNFKNVASEGANNSSPALEWYFKGTPHSYQRSLAPAGGSLSGGGFFSDYFSSGNAAVTTPVTDNASVLSALEKAFDLSKNDDGSYSAKSQGQIAYLGVENHAVTCYGFNVDSNGTITSVLIADSDDFLGRPDTTSGKDGYSLVTLYTKAKDGKLYLYKDADYVNTYGDRYIDYVEYINTPEELKAMYADYTSAETSLTWNGKLESTWSSDYTEATTDVLPTAATGWEVYVDAGESAHGKYYATYYDTQRKVEFNDYATYANNAPTISVSGGVEAAGLILSGKKNNYTFTQASSGGKIILSGDISQIGKNENTFDELCVSAVNLIVETGKLILKNNAELTLTGKNSLVGTKGTLSLSDNSTLILQDANLRLTMLNTNIGGTIKFSESAKLSVNLEDFASVLTSDELVLTILTGTVLSTLDGNTFDSIDCTSYFVLTDSSTEEEWLSKYAVQSWLYSDKTLTLSLAIPEPSHFGMLAGLAGLALCAIRRKRRIR